MDPLHFFLSFFLIFFCIAAAVWRDLILVRLWRLLLLTYFTQKIHSQAFLRMAVMMQLMH